jgi:hypothetical protein
MATTDGLMQVLLREYPNGVSFDPMALRLVRQKVQLEDSQIEDLKAQMFQMGDELWFSREMISEDSALLALEEQAEAWLTAYCCFAVKKLFARFGADLRHVTTPANLAAFLEYEGFRVATWGKNCVFCFQSQRILGECLADFSKTITEQLADAGGMVALHEIEEAMPHLTADALSGIRMSFMPEVHEVEIGGLTCWRSAQAIPLPEDFAEKVTDAVDSLVALGERVTAARLQFALNLAYRIHFREEYGLKDNGAFMRVCGKHYQGAHSVFPKSKPQSAGTHKSSAASTRVRRPNTRFDNLGVPIGAELVFTKDGSTTCTVLDDSNQVEYEGESFAISKLAMLLLDVSAPRNGFYHFSYEGENLWERRRRLEREEGETGSQAVKEPLTGGYDAEYEIIGLEGKALSPATWRSYRTDGRNPTVADWVRRTEGGESAEQIARQAGYAVSTVKIKISNYRLYSKVCERNGISLEAGADV